MTNPQEIYDLLLDYGNTDAQIREVLIGLTWTLCQAEAIGLCMSPGIATRTLPWSGTLVNRSIAELALWLRSWDLKREYNTACWNYLGTTLPRITGFLTAIAPARTIQ